jgi:predicted transcriptional regulator
MQNTEKNKLDRLKENVKFLERIMTHLKIDYRIIYLSEAWDRLLKKTEFSSLFQKIISQIKMQDILKAAKMKYFYLKELNISKINYIIADYLIAHYLPELYPEICSTSPTDYIGIYAKVFEDTIERIIKENSFKKIQKISVINNAPIFMHKDSGIIPSAEMTFQEIRRIVKNHLKNQGTNLQEILDFLLALNNILTENEFECNNKKIALNDLKNKVSKNLKDTELISDILTLNLFNYFSKIKKITEKMPINQGVPTLYVENHQQFKDYIKNLNSIKLKILKFCNGKNSSLDIARKTNLNLSTVSTYLSHLKHLNLITEERKPKRKIENLVINLGVLEEMPKLK